MNIFKLFNWKYRYFVKKLDGIDKMIEDLIFKRYKTAYVREQIRREYDQLRSRLEILKTQIASEKDNTSKNESKLSVDEFKRLEDDEVILNRDIERKKSQIDQLDIEVKGSRPTADLPEGHQGLEQTLEALRELKNVTKEYLKSL